MRHRTIVNITVFPAASPKEVTAAAQNEAAKAVVSQLHPEPRYKGKGEHTWHDVMPPPRRAA